MEFGFLPKDTSTFGLEDPSGIEPPTSCFVDYLLSHIGPDEGRHEGGVDEQRAMRETER